MLILRNIHKHYRSGSNEPVHVLKGVNLHIHKGEFVAIMGSSGSGKSTLLNIIGLLDNHDDGHYELDGQHAGKLSETQAALLRNQKLGFVFQSFNLLPFKNATENVALPLYYQGVSRKERNRRAEQALEQVGLAERKAFMPSQLSGGQKQRVAIARALVSHPKVILADEPTGALDDATTVEIMALFKQLHVAGHTIVMVTHDQAVAAQSERKIVLRDGRVVSTAVSDAVAAHHS